MLARISQSGVSDGFRMRIPIYFDFGQPGGPVKAGNIALMGSNTTNEFKVHLPQVPKKVLLNYYHDVLARDVKVEAK